MTRAGPVLPVLLVAACGGDRAAAPPPSRPPAPAALAVPLDGPHPDLATSCGGRELCEEIPDSSGQASREVPSFRAVTPMLIEVEQGLVGCAIAIRTDAGWFLTSPSEDACLDPSYIEVTGVRIEDETDGVVSVSFDVSWHTKNADDEASFTLSALCGDAGGRPACTPMFVSACESNAPAGNCLDAGYELSWTIEAGAVTIVSDRALDGDSVAPVGTHRLF